ALGGGVGRVPGQPDREGGGLGGEPAAHLRVPGPRLAGRPGRCLRVADRPRTAPRTGPGRLRSALAPTGSVPPVRTQILRGRRHWATVGPVWSALAAEVPPRSHLQTAEWAHALTDEFHTDDARWFVAEDDGGPLAVVPFKASVRRYGPLGVRVLAGERLTDGLVHPRLRAADLRRAVLAAACEAGEPVDVLSLNGVRP